MTDYAAARRHMVDGQILPNKVTDRQLIAILSQMPREEFVPKARQGVAYVDEDLEIAPGRYLMEPMVFARLVQAAQVQKSDAVLTVGAGGGYEAAVMARLASVVVALESDEELAAGIAGKLQALQIDNVVTVTGELAAGAQKQGPYDVIFLTGSVDEVPQALLSQLAEGGRLVGVVNRRNIGQATLITRRGGVVGDRVLFDAGTPLLPGFRKKPAFQF
jgi:protein-L-isoaspartate(D-aspartate) O-methyltransferase